MIKWYSMKREEIVERVLKVLHTNTKDVTMTTEAPIKLCPNGEAVILNHTSFEIRVCHPGDEFVSMTTRNSTLWRIGVGRPTQFAVRSTRQGTVTGSCEHSNGHEI
jgi:hypothetical protein